MTETSRATIPARLPPEPITDAVVFVLLTDEAGCGECHGQQFYGVYRDFATAASVADSERKTRGARKTKQWIKDNAVDSWYGDRATIIRFEVLPRGGSLKLREAAADALTEPPLIQHRGDLQRAVKDIRAADTLDLAVDIAALLFRALSAQLAQAQQERDQLKEQFGIQARIDGERIWKLEAQLTEAQATIARLTPAHE